MKKLWILCGLTIDFLHTYCRLNADLMQTEHFVAGLQLWYIYIYWRFCKDSFLRYLSKKYPKSANFRNFLLSKKLCSQKSVIRGYKSVSRCGNFTLILHSIYYVITPKCGHPDKMTKISAAASQSDEPILTPENTTTKSTINIIY